MLYREAIEFLCGLQMFGTNLELENVRRLAERAGSPHRQLRFIHVAGTNGKGSTCAMIDSIYRAAGWQVGLYTSPHLVSFRERIQVNRGLISENDVVQLVTEAKDFRVSLDKADREQVKSDIENAMQRRLVEAQKHVWDRLATTMGHFTERMKNKDAKFKAATIENLAELADILPGLNVVSDPELDAIAKQIKSLVDGCDPKAIRDNEKQRKAIGKEAQSIMNDIGGFMKAFGGGK